MSDSLTDDSKDVLEKIKADGTFDDMRLRVTEAVKKLGVLTQLAEELVAGSDIFSTDKADKCTRKELFEHIRKRHEDQLLDMAAKATWEVLTKDTYGISQQIEQCAHQALCSVYETREQERIALHQQQQQRYQMELDQYNSYYSLQPSQVSQQQYT